MAQGRREEPFGQKVDFGHHRGFVIGKKRLVRRKQGWGAMRRSGFTEA